MITHPDADHVQGIVKLIRLFFLEKSSKPSLVFTGPLLLTRAFECERYKKYMSVFINAGFRKNAHFSTGVDINGFESQFTFMYPDNEYPGVLYEYAPSIPEQSSLSASEPRDTNATSILLVLNDDNDSPVMSFNGDAYGWSVLKSLNGSNPKLFKVPHHGSLKNSIPLQKNQPKCLKLTRLLLATQVLLQQALKNESWLLYDQVSDKYIEQFNNMFKKRELTLRSRKQYVIKPSFDQLLHDIAIDFRDYLEAIPVNPSLLLKILEKRSVQIKSNIANHMVPRVDVYINGVAELPNGFDTTVYNGIKSLVICYSDNNVACAQVFKMIETDDVFSSIQDTNLGLVTEFYNQINARTYIISSGNLHNHPHWCVVNGIIKAACYRRKEIDHMYKCRLLLTSGSNIRGDKLQELSDDWTQAVSLQYFTAGTTSVSIDSKEIDSTSILPGTTEWSSLNDKQEFIVDYATTAGAQFLKTWRASNSCIFEIKPHGKDKQWLGLKPSTTSVGANFLISDKKVYIKVIPQQVLLKHSSVDTAIYCKLHQLSKLEPEETLFVKNSPNSALYYLCSIKNEIIMYLHVVSIGNNITFSKSEHDATPFQFINVSTKSVDSKTSNKRIKKSEELSTLLHQMEATDEFFSFSSNASNISSKKLMVSKEWSNSSHEIEATDSFSSVPLFSSNDTSSRSKSQMSLMSDLLQERQQLAPSSVVHQGLKRTTAQHQTYNSSATGQSVINIDSNVRSVVADVSVQSSGDEDDDSLSYSSKNKTLLLSDFLSFVHHTESTISCQDLFGIVVSHQFCSQLLKSLSPDSKLIDFLAQVLNFNVDPSSTFKVENHYLRAAYIKLVPTSQLLELSEYAIAEVTFIVANPKTIDQSIDMQLETNDDGVSLTLVYHLKCDVFMQSFHNYLGTFGIKQSISKLPDVIMTLLQSESNCFLYFLSLPLVMANITLWNINEEESSVEFATFPTGPIVLSADISVMIPNESFSIDIGIIHLLKLSELRFVIPPQSINGMYMIAKGTVTDVPVEFTCHNPHNINELPELEIAISLSDTSLDHIVSFLHLKTPVAMFNVPLIGRALKDIHITDISFTCKQSLRQSKEISLSKVMLGFQFSNLEMYLPSYFNKLKTVTSQVTLYEPHTASSVKIGIEIRFEFSINDTILSALFTTIPTGASAGALLNYDYTVLIETEFHLVGTDDSSISIAEFLRVFGLGDNFTKAMSFPFLRSLLQYVQLKSLVLSMNTSKKDVVKSFSLQLCVCDWEIIPKKVRILESQFSMDYSLEQWNILLHSSAVIGDHYPVAIDFELVDSNEASLKLSSSNYDFTISKFLHLFELGNMDTIPIVGQFLNIAVTDAVLQTSRDEHGNVVINNGSVSLYTESLNIGSLFSISQIKASVSFINGKDKYNYSFTVSGFITDVLYISLKYTSNEHLLSGCLSIASFKDVNFSEVLGSLPFHEPIERKNNAIFSKVLKFPSVDTFIALKYNSDVFMLIRVLISFDKTLSFGNFSFTNIMFEYNHEDSITAIKLKGEISIKNISVVIEFDLTKDSTEKNTLHASVIPLKKNPLSLRSFVSLFDLVLPPVPDINGENLSALLDVALTKGVVILSADTFDIIGFLIEVKTTREITLLSSPLIKLQRVSLVVNYKKEGQPTTKVYVSGVFTIGNVDMTLVGNKEDKSVVFSLAVVPTSDINYQDSINALTPEDTQSPVIPSNIGIPRQLKVSIGKVVVDLSKEPSNEKSVWLLASSKVDWVIDLGFKEFTVTRIGGEISYKKSLNESQYEACVVGDFQLSRNTSFMSKLHFGSQADTILVISVKESKELTLPSVTDNLLGFAESSKIESLSFQSLLPDTMQSIELSNSNKSSLFLGINFTHKVFMLFGQLVSLGYGFLVAGNFSRSDEAKYGYAFGMSLPNGFKLSNLLSSFSVIDDLVTVRKVNCMIVSMKDVLVKDVVARIDSVKTVVSQSNVAELPFGVLYLDDFSNGQRLESGLSIYCELDVRNSSLFGNMIKFTEGNLPNIIISSMIRKDPSQSIFKAYIDGITLLGSLHFSNILLEYSPASFSTFKLIGEVSVPVGKRNLSFTGKFVCSDSKSEFSAEMSHKIYEPLGMSGVTVEDAKLSLAYLYSKEKTTSEQEIYGRAMFGSADDSKAIGIVLEGHLIFTNYSLVVVRIDLKPTTQLKVSDFIHAVFNGHFRYKSNDYPDISFSNGLIYYANIGSSTSQEISGFTYKSGYYVSADIDIFDKKFTIDACVSARESKMNIIGYAHGSLKLGFAEFTGVHNNGVPDSSKSPELHFEISKLSTSLFLKVGFILFDVAIGATTIGYRSEGGKRILFGTTTFNHDIDILNGSEITFQWSEQDGFQVIKWYPMVGFLTDAFDLMDEIRNFPDDCGSFGKFAFKKSVQSNFEINVSLKKPAHPDTDLADIEITGSYNVTCMSLIIVTVDLPPNIKASIQRKDNFTLHDLPEVIMGTLANFAESIIKQIVKYPEQLAKIVALFVLEEVTEELLVILSCRLADTEFRFLNPDVGGEDVTQADYNEAAETEIRLSNEIELFEVAGNVTILAGILTGAVPLLNSAVVLYAGIISAAGLLWAKKAIDFYRKRSEVSKEKKNRLEYKLSKMKEKLDNLLQLKEDPVTHFEPPNHLKASWQSIEGAQYHVKVTALFVDDNASLGQGKTPPWHTLYDEMILNNELTLKVPYDVIKLNVSVNATVEVNKDGKINHYDGKSRSVNVSEVHPTFHAPTDLEILYHHPSLSISVTATPNQKENQYFFELFDGRNTSLSHFFYTLPAGMTKIHCKFSHSDVELSSLSPIAVRAQSVAKRVSGVLVAQSAFTQSNCLSLLYPVKSLDVSLPHFMEDDQVIELKWLLPAMLKGVTKFLYQIVNIVEVNKYNLLSDEIPFSSVKSDKPVVKRLALDSVVKLLPNSTSSTELLFKVSVSSNSQSIIDSAFIGKTVFSLEPPTNVTFFFSSEENCLVMSWLYVNTSIYGLEILNSENSFTWRKKVLLEKDQNIESGKVGTRISLFELEKVNDPNKQYTVQVYSVATGDTELDSLFPSKAPYPLHVLKPTIVKRFEYILKENALFLLLSQVQNVSKYLVSLRQGSTVIYEVPIHKSDVLIPLETIMSKVVESVSVQCYTQCLGIGSFISSSVSKSANYLLVLHTPRELKFSYDPDMEIITLSCLPNDTNESTYRLGFLDLTKKEDSLSKLVTSTTDSMVVLKFSADLLKDSNSKVWRCFAQTALFKDSDSKLPSRCVFLEKNIVVLKSPFIKHVCINSNAILKTLTLIVTANPVDNTQSLKILCDLLDDNNSLLIDVTESYMSQDDDDITMIMQVSRKIRNWKEMMSKVAVITVRVMAEGSGFFINSKLSEPKSLMKEVSLHDLNYSYDNKEDLIIVTCKLTDSAKNKATKAMLGLFDAANNENIISDVVGYTGNMFSVKLSGQHLRSFNVLEWIVYAQTTGTCDYLPGIVTLPDHVTILHSPTIHSMKYDSKSSRLYIVWSSVENAAKYRVIITYGSSFTEETKATFLDVLMNDKVKNWNEVFKSVSSISLKIVAIGNSLAINSNEVKFQMNRLNGTSNIQLHCTEPDAIVSWEDVPLAKGYVVTIKGGFCPLVRAVYESNTITIPKRLFLIPSIKANTIKTISISVTTVPSANQYLASFPVTISFEMQAQKVHNSQLFGTNSGIINDDGLECNGIPIVGMKNLSIGHYRFGNVRYLRATYYLSDGTTYMGSSHGFPYYPDYDTFDIMDPYHPRLPDNPYTRLPRDDIVDDKISFDKDETIIAVRGSVSNSNRCTSLHYLLFVTQKADGSYKKYGPFGTLNNKDIPIRLSGNIISFFGKCTAGENVNAIGFNYTYTSRMIMTSIEYGGSHGEYFDDDTLTHTPLIVRLEGVKVLYNKNCVIGIQATYCMSDGSNWTTTMHGGGTEHVPVGVASVFIKKIPIIRVIGRECDDRFVSQLSFLAQYSNQLTSVKGPFGGHGDEGSIFIMKGNIIGFYGHIGPLNTIVGLGMYCSLECSDLIGKTNDNTEDFDDGVITHYPQIIGIKNIVIGHSPVMIESVMVTYMLSDGSTWQAPRHGTLCTKNGTLGFLEFEESEDIVEIRLSLHSMATGYFMGIENLSSPKVSIIPVCQSTPAPKPAHKQDMPMFGAMRTEKGIEKQGISMPVVITGFNGLPFSMPYSIPDIPMPRPDIPIPRPVIPVPIPDIPMPIPDIPMPIPNIPMPRPAIPVPIPEIQPLPEAPKQIPSYYPINNVLGHITILTRQTDGSQRIYGPIGNHYDTDKEFVLNGRVLGLFGQISRINESNLNIVSALGAYYIPL